MERSDILFDKSSSKSKNIFNLCNKKLKLATIDIGSNAVRLLISEVRSDEPNLQNLHKLNYFRVPVRLGFDVFESGFISNQRTEMLIQTLKAFRHLINAYGVDHVMVCATSAMRDASNAHLICKTVFEKTGLNIEIISGETEAKLLFENHIAETLEPDTTYMYIDVGGGSTEISVFHQQKLAFNQSYNVGTIRLLKEHVAEEVWSQLKSDIKQCYKSFGSMVGIGSGGNINKVFSLSKRKEGKPINLQTLKNYLHEMSMLSNDERIKLYQIRSDRADVIVPALQIYVQVMRWGGIEEILVPKIGLVDGLTHHLWTHLEESKRLFPNNLSDFQIEAGTPYF